MTSALVCEPGRVDENSTHHGWRRAGTAHRAAPVRAGKRLTLEDEIVVQVGKCSVERVIFSHYTELAASAILISARLPGCSRLDVW